MANNDEFTINLIRFVGAQLHVSILMTASREMFGKSYFSLGAGEKAAVEQTVIGAVGGSYNSLTPDFLATRQSQQPVGFGVPNAAPKQE